MKFSVNQLLCFLMICICLSLASCVDKSKKEGPATIADPVWTELMELSGSVRPEKRWDHEDLNAFLLRIPLIQRGILLTALDKHEEASKVSEKSADSDALVIQKELLWQSSSWVTYMGKDPSYIHYHDIVSWVANEIGIGKTVTTSESTFILERMILTKICADSWDNMSIEQRKSAIEDVVEHKSEIPAYAVLTGLAFYTLLLSQGNLAGFNYFWKQSKIIKGTAKALGKTLPFSAYTFASEKAAQTGIARIIALATSPLGITVAAIAVALSVACMVGKASVNKTAMLIMQLHVIKVAALEAAALPVPECPKYFLKSL